MLSRRRLLLGLGLVAMVGAGATGCAAARQRWSQHLGRPVRGFAVRDGVVFATGGDDTGSATAIDASTGDVLWAYDLRAPLHGPVVVDHLVLVDDRHGVHALDTATGARRWVDEEAWVLAASDGIPLCGRPGPGSGYLLAALDGASGEARWTVPFGSGPDDSAALAALAAGRVHLGMRDVLRTLDVVTGATVWEQPVRNVIRVSAAGPIVSCIERTPMGVPVDELLENGWASHAAFDAASGRQLWRRSDEAHRGLVSGA